MELKTKYLSDLTLCLHTVVLNFFIEKHKIYTSNGKEAIPVVFKLCSWKVTPIINKKSSAYVFYFLNPKYFSFSSIFALIENTSQTRIFRELEKVNINLIFFIKNSRNVKFFKSRPKAIMPYHAGYEEDKFLRSLAPLNNSEIELLASNCTEVIQKLIINPSVYN